MDLPSIFPKLPEDWPFPPHSRALDSHKKGLLL